MRVIAHEIDRRVPRYRFHQARAVGYMAALFVVWLWALLSTTPPLPVWLLSLVVLGGPIWIITERARSDMQRLRGPSFQVVTVDSTPREQLRSQRFNRRENWRQRIWTTVIAGPVGVLVGAGIKWYFDR